MGYGSNYEGGGGAINIPLFLEDEGLVLVVLLG